MGWIENLLGSKYQNLNSSVISRPSLPSFSDIVGKLPGQEYMFKSSIDSSVIGDIKINSTISNSNDYMKVYGIDNRLNGSFIDKFSYGIEKQVPKVTSDDMRDLVNALNLGAKTIVSGATSGIVGTGSSIIKALPIIGVGVIIIFIVSLFRR